MTATTTAPPATPASSAPAALTPDRAPWRVAVGSYVMLTKPRIIELLLVTTVPALCLAARGWPPLVVSVVTLVGGAMAAGSANVLNCVVDRDIDALMHRTERRPTARQTVSARNALVFGATLGVVSILLMALLVNGLAAVLTAGAIAFYVLVYTIWLKRRTSANIVIGGAAGCFPTLIGWAAVRGDISLAALLMFAVVFLWTPPHFWALAIHFREDYARAGVPMLPVVASERVVADRIVAYTVATVAVSLLLVPVGHLGPIYGVSAVVLGGVFLAEAVGLWRRTRAGARLRPLRLFHQSIAYLSLLFLALTVAALLHGR
jgi:protoheme IX farnesyltransferase